MDTRDILTRSGTSACWDLRRLFFGADFLTSSSLLLPAYNRGLAWTKFVWVFACSASGQTGKKNFFTISCQIWSVQDRIVERPSYLKLNNLSKNHICPGITDVDVLEPVWLIFLWAIALLLHDCIRLEPKKSLSMWSSKDFTLSNLFCHGSTN